MRPGTLALLFIYILILFFSGCKDKDIISPVVDTGPISESATLSEPDWISLPVNEEKDTFDSFSVSKLIRADRQDFITINRRYNVGKPGSVSIDCVIVFPLGAIKEDINITMTIDDENGYVTLRPELELNVPAKLTMILKGINPDNIKIENVRFINFDEYEGIEAIDKTRMKFNEEYGSIGVYEAAINELSNYGFTR